MIDPDEMTKEDEAPLTIITAAERMTADEYQRQRTQLKTLYGDSALDAGAKRDQALAALFWRSHWSQDELAQAEGKNQAWVSRRLLLGRFLDFMTAGHKTDIPPNLTERKFRGYWEQTERKPKEQHRFADVVRMMQDDLRLGSPRTKCNTAPLAVALVKKFGGGKPHTVDEMARALNVSPREIQAAFRAYRHGRYGARIEGPGHGRGDGRYRIFASPTGGKKYDSAVLKSRISPLFDQLKLQVKQVYIRHSPIACLDLIRLIEKAIEECAK
jgi:hypothetical protein